MEIGLAGVEIDKSLVLQQRRELAESCLCLPFGMDRVLLVDSHERLAMACEWVDADRQETIKSGRPLVYGLDTEWAAFASGKPIGTTNGIVTVNAPFL